MRIIRPAIKLQAALNEKGFYEPLWVEYDVKYVTFFGLFARAIPNRIADSAGNIDYIEGAKRCWILTYQLGWFRLEER